MITSHKPIGRIIVLANIQKDIISKSNIEHNIENLIDIIKVRSINKKIDVFSESILSEVFDLRIEVIEWFVANNKSVNDFLEAINEQIAINIQNGIYSELSITSAKVLSNYEKIITPIIDSFDIEFKELNETIKDSKPNYEQIKLLSLLPSPQFKYYKEWIDASLRMEIGLIVSDLILTKQIEFPKKRIKNELIPFMIDTITRFGAYAMFIGIWKPFEADFSPIINRMQILAATIELENGIHFKTSKEDLHNLINN